MRLADTGADGFVPAATIGDDYYRHQEDEHALIGDRTGDGYRLGDAVRVRLIEAIPSAGALRFEMLSPGTRLGSAAGRGRGRRGLVTARRHAAALTASVRPRAAPQDKRAEPEWILDARGRAEGRCARGDTGWT